MVTDVISYWMLLVTGGVQAAAFVLYVPARISLISELVPSTVLRNAVVIAQISQEMMRVIAPALAGALIGVAWFGVGGVFIVAGLSSALAALFIVALPKVPPRASHRDLRSANWSTQCRTCAPTPASA